jgi:hypothetical protein
MFEKLGGEVWKRNSVKGSKTIFLHLFGLLRRGS